MNTTLLSQTGTSSVTPRLRSLAFVRLAGGTAGTGNPAPHVQGAYR